MLNKILLSVSIVSLVIGTSFGSANNTITTKGYVDTEIDTKQLTIPVTGTNSSNSGNTVVTYTSTEGALGERELYTGANAYDAESDADKLITAAALNTAFTTLPTLDTNRLTCANAACNLWAITPQTAYGRAGGSGGAGGGNSLSSIMEKLGDGNGLECYNTLSGEEEDGGCSTPPTNYGDWRIDILDDEGMSTGEYVDGISACSTVNEGLSQGGIPTNQSGVQSDYESNIASAPTSEPAGGNCYCKMINPNTSTARWVFYSSSNDPEHCANNCAACAGFVANVDSFRAAVFGM